MGSSALGEESGVVDDIGNVVINMIMVIKWIDGLAFGRCMMK